MEAWTNLFTDEQLAEISKQSFEKPQLIFKHSTRCGISSHIKSMLYAASDALHQVADLHYLDLISFRSLSNQVAEDFRVPHQSPQVLLIKDGQVVHSSSHFSIQPNKILEHVSSVA